MLGITHVVCVCPEGLQALTSSTDHQNGDVKVGIEDENDSFLYIPIEDDEYEDILTHLPRACAFIEKSLLSPEFRVLVHCKMGVSRSVTTVAAYCMFSCLAPRVSDVDLMNSTPVMQSRQLKSFDAVEYIKASSYQFFPIFARPRSIVRILPPFRASSDSPELRLP